MKSVALDGYAAHPPHVSSLRFYINEQVKSYLVQQEINDYSKQAVVT
jgi:hypothetical protein